MTTGEPFMYESKPVGDPSREPYGPQHVGGRIEVPAGDVPEEQRNPAVQAPARNRVN